MRKRIIALTSFLAALLFFFTPQEGYSQWNRHLKGNGQIVKNRVTVPEFNRIVADGADHIILLTKDNTPYTVITETDKNLLSDIRISVKNQTLHITYSDISPTRLKFYITVPSLESIKASGASVIQGADTLSGKQFKLDASGAASVNLMLRFQQVNTRVSGAADVVLSGETKKLFTNSSGV